VQVFVIVYMFYNLWLISYILGTITLLVVRHDERANKYRDRSENLKTYAAMNAIPPVGFEPGLHAENITVTSGSIRL
jgi:hypothetical protein